MRVPHTPGKTPSFAEWCAVLTVSLTASVTACGSGAGDAPDLVSGLKGLDIDYSTLTASLNGSGSSFQDPLQQAVAGQFARHTGGAQVNYQKSGSSAGKADLASNTVQYAGSDSVIKPEEAAEFTGDVLYFPIAASSITISYNLPDVADLNLTPELLAKIFQAEITVWNDPEIVEHNPTASLPAIPIGVIRRSDGSGTTSNFTKYLAKAAPEVWKLGTGESIEWPPSSQGAEKSSGVSILINTTEGAIGYADLSDSVAAGLQRAKVQNSAGNFVEPKLANVSEAIASADIADDLTYDPLNAPGADAYPITAPTWIITYAAQRDHDRAESLRGYLNFFLTEGQAIAPSLGYAPLPEAVRMRAIEQLERIAVP